MKKYEISFIVAPNVEGEELTKLVGSFKNVLVERGANIISEEDLGMKTLAYEINDFQNGHYFLFEVDSNAEANSEFERLAKINENVIRHIIIKL